MIQLKAPVELGLFENLECRWSMLNLLFYCVSVEDCYWQNENNAEDSFLFPFRSFYNFT